MTEGRCIRRDARRFTTCSSWWTASLLTCRLCRFGLTLRVDAANSQSKLSTSCPLFFFPCLLCSLLIVSAISAICPTNSSFTLGLGLLSDNSAGLSLWFVGDKPRPSGLKNRPKSHLRCFGHCCAVSNSSFLLTDWNALVVALETARTSLRLRTASNSFSMRDICAVTSSFPCIRPE